MNTKPITMQDGFVIAKITHTMGGAVYPLAITRYGSRYFLRDIGPATSGSRCSFSINAEDLRKVLDQADAERGTFGDVCWLSIGMDGGGTLKPEFVPDDDDDDEEEPPFPEQDVEEPRVARHFIQATLEGFL